MPTNRELLVLRAKIERQSTPRAIVLANQIAEATTTGTRFQLMDKRKLETLILSAIWMYEQPIDVDRVVPVFRDFGLDT